MNYLNQLAKSENLLPWVKFSSLVTNVVFENDSWKVSVQDANNDVYTEDFDAVVVATGHYAVPFVPDFPGLAELNNNKHIQLLHSREYRHPEQFKDKVISFINHVLNTNCSLTNLFQIEHIGNRRRIICN